MRAAGWGRLAEGGQRGCYSSGVLYQVGSGSFGDVFPTGTLAV